MQWAPLDGSASLFIYRRRVNKREGQIIIKVNRPGWELSFDSNQSQGRVDIQKHQLDIKLAQFNDQDHQFMGVQNLMMKTITLEGPKSLMIIYVLMKPLMFKDL